MSVSPEDSLDTGDRVDSNGPISYRRYVRIIRHALRHHYTSLIILIVLFMAAGLAMIASAVPQYQAAATLGAAPSPLSDVISASSSLSGVLGSGITRQLGLGGHSTGSDKFDQFVQLLTSTRVAKRLAQDPNIMHAVFYTRYDWRNKRWKMPSHGMVYNIKKWLKGILHRPDIPVPGADDMARFLKEHVIVDSPLTSSFVTVSLASQSPEKATWLLNTLLLETDSVIREDKRRDVVARISYLDEMLPSVTQAEQKAVLIKILSDQQETMMTVHADKRYASAIVDPAYASPIPTSPKAMNILATMFLLAVACWGLLLRFSPNMNIFARLMPVKLTWFETGDAHLTGAQSEIALRHAQFSKRDDG